MTGQHPHIAVIGAGIGGLAAALRLAFGGAQVSVFESHASPGGKMRTVPSEAGPVDAGPTVLTLKEVFEDLFEETGSALDNHVTLHREPLLARHFWPDGTTLDLMANQRASSANIARAFGPIAAQEFGEFCGRTRTLFDAFDHSMMRTAAPSQMKLAMQILRQPTLLKGLEPQFSLAASLARQFSEPKLRQLFGRYATYVGGQPDASPALLGLIWQAEAQGVWHVEGGMHTLAEAIEARARQLGATFHYNTQVQCIEMQQGRPATVVTTAGAVPVDAVLFNGNLRAIRAGLLGSAACSAVARSDTEPQSLSACVHSFAAKAFGMPLAAHNVFFCSDPADEFGALARGEMPTDATLYICAQDRFGGTTPTGQERFEIISNAPPAPDPAVLTQEEKQQCHSMIMARLLRFGMHFTPRPAVDSLTMPQDFAALFPASNGALYGRSPHGLMAAFRRPTVRSRIPGLYLVGGGVHPGAGIPMVTRCAAHAAAAILQDLSLTSASPLEATHGGTSMASRTMEGGPSRSSAS